MELLHHTVEICGQELAIASPAPIIASDTTSDVAHIHLTFQDGIDFILFVDILALLVHCFLPPTLKSNSQPTTLQRVAKPASHSGESWENFGNCQVARVEI